MKKKSIEELTQKQLDVLITLIDDDLLKEFPDYFRSDLRRKKKELIKKLGPQVVGELPKILLFDIETAPIEIYAWDLYPQYVTIDKIIHDWFVLTWSAKWLFNSKVEHDRVTRKESLKRDDKRIVKNLWKLMDKADCIIAHNASKFDVPKMNTRFLKYDLPGPAPYQVVDTLVVAKRMFKLTSNKLDYLCRFLGLDVKLDTNFDLWKDCVHGDNKALAKMDNYCVNDVKILEDVYLRLRPYIKSHPNVALYMDSDVTLCPNCGSKDLTWGYKYTTPANQFYTARCKCGAFVRNRASIIDKEKKKVLGQSIAR
ncbi:MAG: ribonuclease H-like domain-containing protein [Parcubacteria group bacterium]|nr:ribonuclease H-like domain-containing protein [Parcubacteria group bacterium]